MKVRGPFTEKTKGILFFVVLIAAVLVVLFVDSPRRLPPGSPKYTPMTSTISGPINDVSAVATEIKFEGFVVRLNEAGRVIYGSPLPPREEVMQTITMDKAKDYIGIDIWGNLPESIQGFNDTIHAIYPPYDDVPETLYRLDMWIYDSEDELDEKNWDFREGSLPDGDGHKAIYISVIKGRGRWVGAGLNGQFWQGRSYDPSQIHEAFVTFQVHHPFALPTQQSVPIYIASVVIPYLGDDIVPLIAPSINASETLAREESFRAMYGTHFHIQGRNGITQEEFLGFVVSLVCDYVETFQGDHLGLDHLPPGFLGMGSDTPRPPR